MNYLLSGVAGHIKTCYVVVGGKMMSQEKRNAFTTMGQAEARLQALINLHERLRCSKDRVEKVGCHPSDSRNDLYINRLLALDELNRQLARIDHQIVEAGVVLDTATKAWLLAEDKSA